LSVPPGSAPQPGLPQFVRFLLVGALNTVIGYGIFAGLVLLGVGPTPALVATYVAGTLINYFTTGRLVFNESRSRVASLARFILAYVVIYFFNLGLFMVVAGAFPNPLVTQALCVPVVAVFSFLLFKLFVFSGPPAGRSA
jgi:putative flippase GtrA